MSPLPRHHALLRFHQCRGATLVSICGHASGTREIEDLVKVQVALEALLGPCVKGSETSIRQTFNTRLRCFGPTSVRFF